MIATAASRLATLLVEAHRAGTLVPDPPVPEDASAAMACQAEVAAALGAVAGWKISLPAQGPLAAPLLAPLMRADGGSWTYAQGLALEVEIAARLARDIPPGSDRAAVEAAVGSTLLGIELVRPRLAAGTKAPPAAFLADNLGNAGYVTGPALPEGVRFVAEGRRCRVTLDGAVLFDGPAAHPQGDILAPLVAWAGAPTDRLGGLRSGQVITTGALCGLLSIPGPGLLVVELDGAGTVQVRIAPPA